MPDRLTTASGSFPGMDPFLEALDIWPDFHDRLAATISSMLNAQLPARYYARLEKRAELGIVMSGGRERRVIPDVSVVQRRIGEAAVAYTAASTAASTAALELPRQQPSPIIDFRVPSDPILHRFVEIRDSQRNHALVTLIEIISPSNKQPGPDRRAYQSKQRDILNSDANLIEIDLLRDGQRLLPYPELEATIYELAPDYLVLLNRSALRDGYWIDFSIYPISLREPLPCILVPLAGEDPDVLLDLQLAFQQTYAGGPYARMVDYAADPEPPLDSEDDAWADHLLRAAGLR